MNNAYFEGQVRQYLENQEDDALRNRMEEVKEVTDAFSNKSWQILLKDSEAWKSQMDARWQDVYDEKILSNMRIVKQAYNFILSVPDRYKKEIEMLESELASREDTKKTIEAI